MPPAKPLHVTLRKAGHSRQEFALAAYLLHGMSDGPVDVEAIHEGGVKVHPPFQDLANFRRAQARAPSLGFLWPCNYVGAVVEPSWLGDGNCG